MLGTIVQTLAPYTIISLKDSPITPDTPTPILYAILTSALPAGLDANVFVYFEDAGNNIAQNVRQAVKTTSRNAQFFTVDTWA